MLGKARIQARLAEIRAETRSSKIMDVQEMQERLSAIARGEDVETLVAKDGTRTLAPALVKERVKAMDLLGKMFGAFVTRSEVDVRGAVPVVIKDDI